MNSGSAPAAGFAVSTIGESAPRDGCSSRDVAGDTLVTSPCGTRYRDDDNHNLSYLFYDDCRQPRCTALTLTGLHVLTGCRRAALSRMFFAILLLLLPFYFNVMFPVGM